MTSRDLLDRDPLGPTARRQVAAQQRRDQDLALALAFDLVWMATVVVVVVASLIAGGGW